MNTPNATTNKASNKTNWSAIFSIAIAVAFLVTVEFLPAGLLTPMSEELNISQGLAGQTLTITAIFAVISSLFASSATRNIDRRYVILGFTVLLILSSLISTFSTNFGMIIGARILLGLALGGFWAMSAYITMQLSESRDIPKALSVVFGGVSVALVLATPAGSFLGSIIGWRGVFLLAAVLGALCLIWQWLVIPSIPAKQQQTALASFLVLKRKQVPAAMLAIFAVFAGQIGFFTYIRPFLESVVQLDVNGISLMLLLFGIANFVGTSVSSQFLQRGLKTTLAYSPLILAVCASILVLFGNNQLLTGLVIIIWGFTFGLVPVGWSTWVTQSISDDAESAGGLQVAVIQIANAFGAALGGLLLDFSGSKGPLEASILFLVIAGVTVFIRVTSSPAKMTLPVTD